MPAPALLARDNVVDHQHRAERAADRAEDDGEPVDDEVPGEGERPGTALEITSTDQHAAQMAHTQYGHRRKGKKRLRYAAARARVYGRGEGGGGHCEMQEK